MFDIQPEHTRCQLVCEQAGLASPFEMREIPQRR